MVRDAPEYRSQWTKKKVTKFFCFLILENTKNGCKYKDSRLC